jgi:hypothetical protein
MLLNSTWQHHRFAILRQLSKPNSNIFTVPVRLHLLQHPHQSFPSKVHSFQPSTVLPPQQV